MRCTVDSHKIHSEEASNERQGQEQDCDEGKDEDSPSVIILECLHQMYVLYCKDFGSFLKLGTILELLSESDQDPFDTFLLEVEPHFTRYTRCIEGRRFQISSKLYQDPLLLKEHSMHNSNFLFESVDHL